MDMGLSFDVPQEKNPKKEALLRYSKIVFIGCSRNENKDAHTVPKFMKEHGYEIACVNPFAEDKILDAPTYKDVSEVPDEYLEIIDVFRPSEEIPKIVDQIIESGKIPKVFWMQDGIRSEYARQKLEPLGVTVIEDSCIMRAYMELFAEKDATYEAILRFARAYAKAQGFVLNPDPEKLDEIISGLAYNQKMHGFRYCPCRPLSGDPKEDAKKICPCFWHKEEIKRDGHCHCGLFWDPRRVPEYNNRSEALR